MYMYVNMNIFTWIYLSLYTVYLKLLVINICTISLYACFIFDRPYMWYIKLFISLYGILYYLFYLKVYFFIWDTLLSILFKSLFLFYWYFTQLWAIFTCLISELNVHVVTYLYLGIRHLSEKKKNFRWTFERKLFFIYLRF